jgi:hypothetical protein
MPEIRCTCGHRMYDHMTPDGICWKCGCTEYRTEHANQG